MPIKIITQELSMMIYKISFVTVCMNRKEHLIKTLIKNIEDNRSYPNLEFVLLDYNSNDGLGDFVKQNMSEYIASGKLVYFRTNTPKYFNRSHSRNLVFKVATGEIICNVDADNFIGKGFGEYINDIFNRNKNCFLCASGKFDVIGRIAVFKTDFYKVNGFDERMVYYGFEDLDFIQRLTMSGLKPVQVDSLKFLRAVSHSNKERMANESVVNEFIKLFISYQNPSSSYMIYLFQNNLFYFGNIISRLSEQSLKPRFELRGFQYDYYLKDHCWQSGEWHEKNGEIVLGSSVGFNNRTMVFNKEKNAYLLRNEDTYYEIKDNKVVEEALFFYSQITNRYFMEMNQTLGMYKVNIMGFGKDIMFKNFVNEKIELK